MTNYVLLAKREGTENEWVQFTAMTADSARGAIRAALQGDENQYGDGEYIAVPARSWRPVRVTLETKTEVRLDAKASA